MSTRSVDILIQARDQASGVARGVGSTFKQLGDDLKGMLGPAALASAALYGLMEVKDKVLAAFGENEEQVRLLNQVIKSTGGLAERTGQQMTSLAAQLQDVTKFNRSTIESGEKVLATFTQIKGVRFDAALKSSLDLSTVMGQDLQSSIVQVGKALNDPITGMTALKRIGVTFSETQKEQIKDFIEQNDLMKAQDVILKELSTEFGGSAAAAAETYNGKIAQLNNSMNDLAETVGKFLAPSSKEWSENLQTSLGMLDQDHDRASKLHEAAQALHKRPGEGGKSAVAELKEEEAGLIELIRQARKQTTEISERSNKQRGELMSDQSLWGDIKSAFNPSAYMGAVAWTADQDQLKRLEGERTKLMARLATVRKSVRAEQRKSWGEEKDASPGELSAASLDASGTGRAALSKSAEAERKKMWDERKKQVGEANKVFNETRTPEEKFASQIEELKKLKSAAGGNLIDDDTFNRKVAKLKLDRDEAQERERLAREGKGKKEHKEHEHEEHDLRGVESNFLTRGSGSLGVKGRTDKAHLDTARNTAKLVTQQEELIKLQTARQNYYDASHRTGAALGIQRVGGK